jgi:hypothetical protein
MRNAHKILVGNIKRGDCLRDLCVDGRLTLELGDLNLKVSNRMWNALKCLRIGPGDGLF